MARPDQIVGARKNRKREDILSSSKALNARVLAQQSLSNSRKKCSVTLTCLPADEILRHTQTSLVAGGSSVS